MGALDGSHHGVELEISLKLGCIKLGIEEEPEISQIKDAVKILLQGLGEDINREGLKKTPLRVAQALREGTRGYKQKVEDIVQGALFPEAGVDHKVGHAGGAGGLVIVRDLDLFSYCESCLLPFPMKCHVGYVPSGQRVVGLSKLSRVADVFAKRLQEPQRLADEVCSALHHAIKPAGVAVILECLHIHFPTLESTFQDSSPEGWKKVMVSSGSGVFEDEDASIWREFLSLLKYRTLIADNTQKSNSANYWCPSQVSPSNVGTVNPGGMVNVVSSVLRSLGEDPSRKELVNTPARFVKWLMNFQNSNLEMKMNEFIISSRSDPQKSNGEGKKKFNKQIHSELNLPFWSQCEHHLLPFNGVVHIGYFCNGGVSPIGKSLIQSIVHFYGFKLQVQERLTRQIAEKVAPLLGGDIMVVAEASHTCMISRGIEKFGSSTATVAVLGQFSTDPEARALFLASLPSTNNFHA